jgi:hypothetical protein
MQNSPQSLDYLPVQPIRYNTVKKIRRLFYAAILVASALNNGCVSQQNTKVAQTHKKYDFTKLPEVKVVKREINFCAASIKDVREEAKRCVSNVIINNVNGLHCLKCTIQTEQVQY